MPAATLSIPPLAEHVRTARVVAVAAARRAGLGEDVVDDVRLAVGEMVARAVLLHGARGSDRDVDLVVRDDGHDFTVEVSGEAGPESPDGDADVALALVNALVPQVGVDAGTVTLGWPLTAPA